MGNLLVRLLTIVSEKASGKPTVFAKKAGIPPSTFQYYVKGRVPHGEHLTRICEYYNVNINWLLTGKGDKYIPEEQKNDLYRDSTDSKERMPPDENPLISDLLEAARRVLRSGDPLAFETLERNIRYFDHAVATEQRLSRVESELADIKTQGKRKKTEDHRKKHKGAIQETDGEDRDDLKKARDF